jgi:hypothetical protein
MGQSPQSRQESEAFPLLGVCHEGLRVYPDQHISAPLLDILDPSNRTIAGVGENQFAPSYRQAVQRFSVALAARCRYFKKSHIRLGN